MTKKADQPVTDPNDPAYDPAKDPKFMEATTRETNDGPQGDPSHGAIPSLNPNQELPGEPLMDAQYNQDGSIKNPLLVDRDEADGNYRGQTRTETIDGEPIGPAGMPPANPADGPWAVDVVPTGWSRFPTQEEADFLNDRYPMLKGAPYQPGGHGIEEDKRRENRDADARFNADGSAKETDQSENTDPYSK